MARATCLEHAVVVGIFQQPILWNLCFTRQVWARERWDGYGLQVVFTFNFRPARSAPRDEAGGHFISLRLI